MADREDLIKVLHDLGLEQKQMIKFLMQYGCRISERHLRRILRNLGLYRRKHYCNIEEVIEFIRKEIEVSGQLHGYRWMAQKCEDSGIKVRREDVRVILSMLDPAGTSFRRRRRLRRRRYIAAGPHFVWHLDGYDKIKPFGFGISGCIDGFSRRLIWLNVYRTNNDPLIIAGYFFEAMQEYSGCPRIVRADPGTENIYVKTIQQSLMDGNQNSYIEGSSTSNHRIECFWGQLRKQCMEFWISLFNDLQDSGDFLGDVIDRNLLQFCFLAIIQGELDKVFRTWNNHNIRGSTRGLPSGRPNVMMEAPELYNTVSYLSPKCSDVIEVCRDLCTFRTSVSCDDDIYEYCCLTMRENTLSFPDTTEEALTLYLQLRILLRNALHTA